MGKPKKKKAINPIEGIKYTICGEWFPDVYPALRSLKWSRGDEDPLDTEMRLFCSCTRRAFNRLLEGRSREELKKEGQEIFGLNSRYCDDAILKAREIIGSQRELLIMEIKGTETKLARAKKKLGWAEKDLAKAIKAGDTVKSEKAKRTVQGRKMRVKKLAAKLEELQAHQNNGTIPRVVFGGRALWRRVCQGKATREEWRNARQNRLYARGDETKGGNPNIKVSYRNGDFSLSVTISHLSEQKGTDKKGRPIMTRAPKVTGRLWLPEKHRQKALMLLLSRTPYSSRFQADVHPGEAGLFNRMAANFPFRKISEAVMRRAVKEGVGVKPVWPAHTSTIGYWKYMRRYGIIVHHAAALAIARRAIGFKERITEELRQKIQAVREKLIQKANSLPGEGKGMTRKVKRLVTRLDGKIPLHNGLTRFKQESFYSVWHDLKQLALSSR
ncbi:MAG: transposase [Thermoanaerobacteraceae bacterium]|nr:transposase [Thermoanaerobacteraceae bacterium]